VSAYLLCQCAFQLLFGKIYTFYSVKWTYLAALFIFEVGSLICGVAPTSTALIIGRAIAGLGGAGLFSGSLLIVAYTVPLRQRPTYMGMVGSMYGIASVAGPLLGGAFTDNLTWRWCFYINLPFGAITAVFIFLFFVNPPRAREAAPSWLAQIDQMDPFGTVAFMVSVICLLLALQWGGSKYEWSSGNIIALLVVFGVLAIVFVGIQWWKQEKATVPPRIFKNQNVWGGALFAACLGGAFFTLVYYLPIWFQAIKGVSAVKSGIMSLPLILGTVIMSMVAGGLTTIIG
jgi:MFS family permease